MTLDKRQDVPLLAIGFYVGNLLLMVLITSLVKLLGDKYPVGQILFFRFTFAVIPLFIFMAWRMGLSSMKTRRYKDHAIRTIAGVASLSLFFFALTLIPMAEATMLAYASPIFVTIFAIPMLAEKIGVRRWGAVLIGFTGAIIIVQPGTALFGIGSLIAIAAAISAAIVSIWVRLLSDTESVTTTSIIYNASGMLIFGFWVLLAGWVSIDSIADLVLLISIGLVAGVQQYFYAIAFRYAEASMLAPVEYSILGFAAIAGYLFWNEIPPLTSVIGGVLIVSSGLIIFSRSRFRPERIIRN